MYKKNLLILVMCLLSFDLSGCSRQQQGVDTVYFREKPEDFTSLPSQSQPQKIEVPAIPGKAVIAGAPIVDFPTQTGSAVSTPNQIAPSIP
jgi:hypothetical protein